MMKSCNALLKFMIVCGLIFLCSPAHLKSETIEEWYANAQQRIDTLRKGNFGIKIFDKNGNPYNGPVSIRLQKHEFPFGIAFDLYEGDRNYGNSYSTTSSVSAPSDKEIYQVERWYSSLSYAIPVEKQKTYRVILKFAEIYFNDAGSRLFDVYIEGNKVLSGFDVYAAAGGKNIAVDTSFTIQPMDSLINIDLFALKDNAAIKGIEVIATDASWIKRINCGGNSITTSSGNFFESDTGYFNKNVARIPTDEDWMKAIMPMYFNYGVSGNSFKWSGIQPQHTAPDYRNFDNAVRFAQSVGWDLKAHTLLWGGYNYEDDHALPRWVKDLPTPQAIYDTCKMRVIREVTRYRGIVKEYDVMNEPLHALYLASRVGDSINWNCFKWARSADPDANLIINDYNVEYNWGDARKFRDLILKMKSMNIPVTGVGMQAHFWQGMRPNLVELVTNVNIVAEAGLPIKFTEFDNGVMPEEDQAKDLVLVTTIAFSHPMMNGIICWGLSDKGAWREKSGLFTENRRPKKAADTLLYLTKKRWTTNVDTIYSGNDALFFNAYYGNYIVEVKFGDTAKVFTIPCIKANKDSVFVLNEKNATLRSPMLIAAQLVANDALELVFDKEIMPESINPADFKFFSDNPLRIVKILSDSTDAKKLIVTLQNNITPNDYLTIHYFQGGLRGKDGSKVATFGPVPMANLTAGMISASVINNGSHILVAFNTKMANLNENKDAFLVKVNGIQYQITGCEYYNNDSSKAVFTIEPYIKAKDKIAIQYIQGTLRPIVGFSCATSPVMTVTNLWPSVVRAELDKNGMLLKVTFNTQLQNALANINNFSVMVNNQQIELLNMKESGTDSTILSFTLSDTIRKGDKVVLSYTAGSITAYNGNKLETFTNLAVWNYSTVTGVSNVPMGKITLFPNPTGSLLKISSENPIVEVRIYDTYGKHLSRKVSFSSDNTMDVSSLKNGIYWLQIIDNRGRVTTERFIIQR